MQLRVKEYHLLSLAEATVQLGDLQAAEQDCREAKSSAANDSAVKLAVLSVLANITEKYFFDYSASKLSGITLA